MSPGCLAMILADPGKCCCCTHSQLRHPGSNRSPDAACPHSWAPRQSLTLEGGTGMGSGQDKSRGYLCLPAWVWGQGCGGCYVCLPGHTGHRGVFPEPLAAAPGGRALSMLATPNVAMETTAPVRGPLAPPWVCSEPVYRAKVKGVDQASVGQLLLPLQWGCGLHSPAPVSETQEVLPP